MPPRRAAASPDENSALDRARLRYEAAYTAYATRAAEISANGAAGTLPTADDLRQEEVAASFLNLARKEFLAEIANYRVRASSKRAPRSFCRAFQGFGGVTAEILFDNATTIVVERDA